MISLTSLTGSTATNSATLYPNAITTLAQNNSAANIAFAVAQVNNYQRFLLQKYFDNERTSQTTTVGGMSLTTTATIALGATSATLTASWTYPTVTQLVTFSDGEQRSTLFTNSSTAITWTGGLTASATTAIKSVGVQDYTIPANVSKIKDNTLNVGQLKYVPIEIKTRQEWDLINFLPYTSDIPQYYFIYNGKLSIFPIPSTTGNIITFNYKTRVIDMNINDYTTPGTITTMTSGSTSVTGTSTTWATTLGVPTGVDISYLNLYLRADPPKGDGIWYPISQITSDTVLVLANTVINTATTGATFTIGQMPLLSEDFHTMLTDGPLMTYFSSIVENPNKYKQFEDSYNKKLELLAEYAGTKSVQVDLGQEPNMTNTNLFYNLPN